MLYWGGRTSSAWLQVTPAIARIESVREYLIPSVPICYLPFCPGANQRAILNLPRIIVGSLPSIARLTFSKTTNASGRCTSYRKWTRGGHGLLVSIEAKTV